eukprot:29937-Amphidinium_carterae.1
MHEPWCTATTSLIVLGDEDDVRRMDETLKSRYDCKSGGALGPDDGDDSEVTYLNRVIRYVKGPTPRLEIEHDMRHLDYLM